MLHLRKISFLGLLTLLWLLSIAIVNPVGDFPLNDDWAFAEGVYSIVQKGRLIPSDWPAMTLVAQLYWGALFCKVFGLSATVLRWCTLISSLVGVISFYLLGCEISKNRSIVAFTSLVLFFNPLYFSLSFTFMTDVHFLCTILLAFLFFTKEFKSQSIGYWILGTLFSILATLIRQPGLMIPLTYALILLLQRSRSISNLLKGTVPLALSILAYLIYMSWLNTGNDTVQTVHIVDHLIQGVLQNDWAYFLERMVTILLYVGLFALPFALFTQSPLVWESPTSHGRKILLGCLLMILLYFGSNSFPFGNVLYNLGLGPKILKDTYWGDNIHPQLPDLAWKALTYPSILIATLLLFKLPISKRTWNQLISKGPIQTDRLIRLALFIVMGIYAAFLIIGPYLFDRYLLPLIVFSLLFFLPFNRTSFSKLGQRLATVSLFLYLLFSLVGTHHYLSWNRTRWQALEQLMNEKGIAASNIDGGFEFNTWLKTGPYNKVDRHGKSWWRVVEDEYVIAMGQLPDFEVREQWPVKAVWPFHRDTIFVLWHMVDGMTEYKNYPIICGAEDLAPDPYYFSSNLPQIKFHHEQAQTQEKAHSGQYSMALTEGKEYGFSTVLKDIRPGDHIRVRVWRWDNTRSSGLVMSSIDGGNFYAFEKVNVIQEENGWQQLELSVQIPANPGFNKLGIYVWNPVKVDAWFDDIEIDRKPGQAVKEVVE